MPKHVYQYNHPAHRHQSQSDQHWTEVINYAHQHNIITAANQYKHARNTVSKHYKHWLSQGKPDLYHLPDQRHNKSSRLGDTGDELVASIINKKLDDGNEVHYDDVKQAILDTTSLTPPTRSHGPARTTVGNSAVQRILNKYNFTVGKAQPTKHRAGDELIQVCDIRVVWDQSIISLVQ